MSDKKDNTIYDREKVLLEKELTEINREIKALSYKLSELLNIDCNLGVCTFDPEVNDVQGKIKEIEEKRGLLEFLKKNLEAYKKGSRF